MDATRPALERIVIGMDFGVPSIEAARWIAGTFARGAELVMTHALDLDAADTSSAQKHREDEDAARRRLHDVAHAIGALENYRAEVRADGAARAILDVATECGADMIVVGPHGGRETTRGVGTTAERLIRTSPVPVLLVAHPRSRLPKQLLVPVDGGELTPLVLEWSDFLARRDGAGLALMHVLDPRPQEERAGTLRDDRWLQKLVSESPEPRRTTSITATGNPADEILRAAGSVAADLVVMGRRGQRRAVSGVVGSTASDLLRQPPCPVLIIVDPPDAMFDEWN